MRRGRSSARAATTRPRSATSRSGAGVGLGTFYVYFKSKEEVFRALVADMGARTRHALSESVRGARNRLEAERLGIQAYLDFVRSHKALYRVVMEAQFVAPEAYRDYYRIFAAAYRQQLAQAAARGEISAGQTMKCVCGR